MEPTYSEPVGDAQQYEPDYHRISDYLGVDAYERRDAKLAQKVTTLRQWAKENASEQSIEGEASALNELRNKVGTRNLGKTLINELYQHLRFQSKSPTKNARSKKAVAKVQKSKASPIAKVVAQSANQEIAKIVARTISPKNITYMVNEAIKGAFK